MRDGRHRRPAPGRPIGLIALGDSIERLPRWLRIGVFALGIAATVAVSVVPRLPSAAPRVNDKLGHTLVYGVNGVLAAVAFPSAAGLGWALAGLLAMGTGLELLQVALPRRQGSWLDAGANALGLGLGGAVLLRRRVRSA